MDRGVVVGVVLICASLLVALVLNKEARYGAVPRAIEKPTPNVVHPSESGECTGTHGVTADEHTRVLSVAPIDRPRFPAQERQATDCR
jgi:hypothetical protein